MFPVGGVLIKQLPSQGGQGILEEEGLTPPLALGPGETVTSLEHLSTASCDLSREVLPKNDPAQTQRGKLLGGVQQCVPTTGADRGSGKATQFIHKETLGGWGLPGGITEMQGWMGFQRHRLHQQLPPPVSPGPIDLDVSPTFTLGTSCKPRGPRTTLV